MADLSSGEYFPLWKRVGAPGSLLKGSYTSGVGFQGSIFMPDSKRRLPRRDCSLPLFDASLRMQVPNTPLVGARGSDSSVDIEAVFVVSGHGVLSLPPLKALPVIVTLTQNRMRGTPPTQSAGQWELLGSLLTDGSSATNNPKWVNMTAAVVAGRHRRRPATPPSFLPEQILRLSQAALSGTVKQKGLVVSLELSVKATWMGRIPIKGIFSLAISKTQIRLPSSRHRIPNQLIFDGSIDVRNRITMTELFGL